MCGYGSGNEKGIEGGGFVSKYYPGSDNSCYGSEAASYSSLGLAESYSSDGTYSGGICSTSVAGAAISSASHGALYNAASRIVIDGGKKAIYAAALGGMLAQNVAGVTYITSSAYTISSGYLISAIVSNYGSLVISSYQKNISSALTSRTSVFNLGSEIVMYGKTYFTNVSSGGVQIVGSMRTGIDADAMYTHVYNGGSQLVLRFGMASGTYIHNGGVQRIDGGTAYSTYIMDGGMQYLSSGKASATVVSSGGRQNVYSGGSAINTVVSSGGNQNVINGSAIDTTVSSGGNINVNVQKASGNSAYASGSYEGGGTFLLSDGVASGFVVSSGGSQNVYSGGSAIGTYVRIGGNMNVSVVGGDSAYASGSYEGGGTFLLSSGVASGFVVSSGGSQNVYSGGSAIDTYVRSGGNVNVSVVGGDSAYASGSYEGGGTFLLSGGVASGFVISSGGRQVVSDGGRTSNTVVSSGGSQIVSNSALYANAYAESTVLKGGMQIISNGGTASGTVVSSAGVVYVSSGGSAKGIYVCDGGDVRIAYLASNTYAQGSYENGGSFLLSGYSASGFAVNSGNRLSLDRYSHVAIGTIVNNGGTEYLSYGGTASHTIVNSGGIQYVAYSGRASNAVLIGGSQIVSKGIAVGTVVSSGGSQIVQASGYASGTVINSGGMQIVQASGSASGTVINNGGRLFGYGTIYDVVVNSGGDAYGTGIRLTVNSGGIASIDGSGIVVNSGGNWIGSGNDVILNPGAYGAGNASNITLADAHFNGSAYNATINKGGIIVGSMFGGTINGGGILSGSGSSITINSGGVLYGNGGGTINNGGVQSLGAGGSSYATINSGGKVIVNGSAFLKSAVGNGGTVEIAVSGSSADKVFCSSCTNIQLKVNMLAEADYRVWLGSGAGVSLKGGSFDYGTHKYVLETSGSYYDNYLTLTGELSNIFYNAITAPAATVATVQTSLNSLQKRMGELRLLGNQSETGTWGRTYYKNLTIKGTDTDLSAYGAEAGYDWHYGGLPEWLGGDYSADISTGTASGGEGFYMGYMAGGTYLDVKGKSMEGSGLNALAGGYATYIAEDGTFLDATLRLGLNRVETKSYKPDGDVLSFTPNRIFVAVSLEGGRTYQIANTKWILEPKGELSVLAMPGTTADITGAEKGSIKFGMGTFINAKAALRAFYSYKNKRGFENVPYAEVAYSKDLKAESDVTYAGNTYPGSGKVEQFEGRLGINYQMSSNLYWNVAAEFESGDRTQGFGLDAGIRYMFGGKSKTENATTVALDDSAKEEENKNIIPAEIVMPENPELTAVEVVVPEETVAENIQSSPSSRRRRRSNAAAGNSESAQKTPNDKFSELNAEEYVKKALEAEKQYAESGTMAIPSAGLLFQIGKSEVLPYYQPMLDSFIKLYKQTDGNAKILIEAYSSNGGNETAKNPELSKQRAKSIYQYLVSNGIPKENITVKAYSNKKIGEGLFQGDTGCKAGQCYRRVDIRIIGN